MPNMSPLPFPHVLDVLHHLVVNPQFCRIHVLKFMDLVDFILGLLLVEGDFKNG
jgi:hypothetical protein